MQMYYVYVLKSLNNGKFYIGHSENINNRLKMHNSGLVKSTRNNRPWKIIHIEIFSNKNEAYKRELQIKSYKGGEAFKKLIKRASTKAAKWV